MLSRLSSVLLLAGLTLDFVGTALAAPAPAADPADMLAGLAPRQGTCPTVTLWAHVEERTTILHSTTVTDTVSILDKVTSTEHVTTTVPATTRTTVFSPAVITLPTSIATSVVATVTTTFFTDVTAATHRFSRRRFADPCDQSIGTA
ncbi:hypothetical protein VTK56DRAFT_3487 [Thermocarpiscus australiensis]